MSERSSLGTTVNVDYVALRSSCWSRAVVFWQVFNQLVSELPILSDHGRGEYSFFSVVVLTLTFDRIPAKHTGKLGQVTYAFNSA